MDNNSFVIKGDICYSKTLTELRVVKSGYIVCVDGKSKGVFETLPEKYNALPIYDYSDKLIIPGMVDMHTHAPQYAFRAIGMDRELMEWLQVQAFPQEAKYENLEYATKAYSIFVDAMKKNATTHVCAFATKHKDSAAILMDLLEKSGLESYIGKVNMDREAPEFLCEPNANVSANDTIEWIDKALKKYKHTKPILTPRFIPSCTSELLKKLQAIQEKYNLPLQSHLSENKLEIEFVKQLCPDSKFYGDAYDMYGLFGKNHSTGKLYNTIMAHCVYCTEPEIELLKENGVFIAHCPASNMNLASGIAPVRKYLDYGLKVGLGSDVAGAEMESMFKEICNAIQVSKLYWRIFDQNAKPLSFNEAFYLATKGGGEFFGKVGSFENGYDFNAVVLDDSVLKYPIELNINERIERAVYHSLDLYGICSKYVNGKEVYSKENFQEVKIYKY